MDEMQNRQPNFISSRHYVQLAEQFISIGFWNADMASGEIRGTDGFLRLLNLSTGEALTVQRWVSMLHPEDSEDLRSVFSLSGMGVSVSRDVRVVQDDRPPRWIRVAAERSVSTGRLAGLVQDLSAEREAKAAIYQARARLATFADATSGVFWTVDPAGTIVDLTGWEAMTGQAIGECHAAGWIAMIHPDERAGLAEKWAACLRDHIPFESRYRLRYADGVYRQVLARCLPVFHEDGTVIEWLGGLQEIWRLATTETDTDRTRTSILKPQQLRAARAMLGWPATRLAAEAGISAATISRYEATDEHMKDATVTAIIAALERHGIVLTHCADGIGIRQKAACS